MESFTEFWRLFLRRFWLIAAIGTIGVALSIFYAFIKPPIYETQVNIAVKGQIIPEKFAPHMVPNTAEEHLRLIEKRLMSRANLQNLIDELRLFQKREDLSIGDRIALLRDATRIEINDGKMRRRGDDDVTAIKIKVTFDDAETSAKLSNRFATMFLEDNLKAREKWFADILRFLEGQVQQGQKKVTEKEESVASFKKDNSGVLPENLAVLQAELLQLNLQVQELTRLRKGLENERDNLRSLPSIFSDGETSEVEKLRQLETVFAQKGAMLSPQHPEIQALKEQIASLKVVIEEKQQTRNERELARISTEIAGFQKDLGDLGARRFEIQALLRRAPSVEIELDSLEQELADAQERLSKNKENLRDTEISAELEFNQNGETLDLIEEAAIPEYPVAPNRKKIAAMGSAISVTLALAIAYVIEMLWPRIRTAAQMQRTMKIQPVITVPYVRTQDERRFRLTKILMLVLVFGTGVLTALYQVDQNYMPLEKVAGLVAEKTGLEKVLRWTETRF